ncbi:MAG: hypothetical protein HZA70_03630 [Planctomycetes bacterium]|nr:hypothetical protein [Planctomycetota bacterium]
MWWDAIGVVAAICTTSGFLPQLVRGVKTRRLDDVSPGLLVLLIVGGTLWFSYGMHKWDKIIMAANAVAVSLASALLFLRSYYIKQRDKVYDGRDKERYR